MSLTALRRAVSAARTESGEKAAVAKILSAAGHRKQPHVQSHRNGRNVVRTYLWRDTPMGSLVLVTGPSVDGQVHRVEKVTGDVSADDVTCYVPKQGRTPAYAAFKPGRGPRGRQSRQKRPRASQGRRNPFSFAAFKAAAEDEFAQGGTGVVSSYEEETARPLSELDEGCPSASRAPVYGVLYDANGRKYRVLYRAIQTRTDGAGPLLPSNTPEFEESPGYPVEFQARSLSRPGEQAKIRKIARELDPNRLLLPHADPTFGAPVVWEGNGERDTQRGTYYVLGGNSRTIALMRAPEDRYRAYAEQAARLWPDVWPDEPAPDGFRTVIVRQAFPDDCPTMQDARALNKACQMPFGRAQALAGATQRSMAGEEDPLGEALSLVRGLGIPQDRLAAALGSVDWRTIVDRTNVAEFLAAHRSLVDTLRGIMGAERYNTALAGVPEIAAKTVNALLIGFLPRSVIEQGFGNDREERAVLASLPMMVSLATGVERGAVPASWALLPHMEEARAFADKFRGKPYGQIASAVQAAFKQQSLGLLSGGGQKVEALLKGMSPLGILLGMVFVRAERLRDPLYAIEDTLQPYVEAAFEVESKYDTGKATGQGGLFGAGIGAKPALPPGLAVKTLGDLVADKVSAQARSAWKAVIDVLVERAKAAPAPVAAPAAAPAAAAHPEHGYWLRGLGEEDREAWTALLDAVAEAEALPSTLHKGVKFSPADVTQRARQDFLAPAQRGDANRFNPQGVRDEAERIVARIEDARDLSAMWSESEAAPAPEPDLFGGTPAPAPAPAPIETTWQEITALNRDPGGLRITSRGDENVYIDVPTVGSAFIKVPDPDTFTLDDPGAQFREPEPAAADLSPIPYADNMPPGLVQPAQIDPDTYYMLWEQSPGGGWVQERSYRGQYILDALVDGLRQKAQSSRPMIVMPMGDVPEPVRAAAPAAAPSFSVGDKVMVRSLYPDLEPDFAGNFRGVMGGQGVVVVEETGAQMAVPLDRLYKPAGPPPGSLTARAEALADKIEALYADAEAATRFAALRVGVTGEVIDAETLRKRIPVLSKADLEDFEEDYQRGVEALAELRAREAKRAPAAPAAASDLTADDQRLMDILGIKGNGYRYTGGPGRRHYYRTNPALSEDSQAVLRRYLTERKGLDQRTADGVVAMIAALAVKINESPADLVKKVVGAIDPVIAEFQRREAEETRRLLEADLFGEEAPAPEPEPAPEPAPAPMPAPDPTLAVPPYDIENRTTRSGSAFVVLIPEGRVSSEEWKRRVDSAKRAGSRKGWTRKFGKQRGGYPFDTREDAEAWWFSYFGAEAPEAAPMPVVDEPVAGQQMDGLRVIDQVVFPVLREILGTSGTDKSWFLQISPPDRRGGDAQVRYTVSVQSDAQGETLAVIEIRFEQATPRTYAGIQISGYGFPKPKVLSTGQVITDGTFDLIYIAGGNTEDSIKEAAREVALKVLERLDTLIRNKQEADAAKAARPAPAPPPAAETSDAEDRAAALRRKLEQRRAEKAAAEAAAAPAASGADERAAALRERLAARRAGKAAPSAPAAPEPPPGPTPEHAAQVSEAVTRAVEEAKASGRRIVPTGPVGSTEASAGTEAAPSATMAPSSAAEERSATLRRRLAERRASRKNPYRFRR